MIRNIVFDMGGVLIAWDPARIVARLGLSGEDARLLRREVFQSVEWVSLDRGTLSEREALERFSRRLPERLHEAAIRCVYWWKEELWPTEGMAELIRELDSLGYGIYLLSNATSALHGYFPRIPGAEHFRGLLVSADWKLLKPQREIYEKLFSRLGLERGDCLFVDDYAPNIEGANVAGMDGIVFFRDMARLRRDLRDRGVPVEEER
jgi:putative hydrolase of the HAD superfamily